MYGDMPRFESDSTMDEDYVHDCANQNLPSNTPLDISYYSLHSMVHVIPISEHSVLFLLNFVNEDERFLDQKQ